MNADRPHSLPELIERLLQPDAYPHQVHSVELIQTHISYVLLAGDLVYKIRKPVDFGFLNFSTLGRRRYYAHQEVTLNSRLCPELYLGVVAVRRTVDGYRVGGRSGRVVEYAVCMRRLPQDRMLDSLVASGGASGAMIDDLAGVIADFHRRSRSTPAITRYGSPRVIRRNWEENFTQTLPFVGDSLSMEQFGRIRATIRAYITRSTSLFERRVTEGFVRDCHGDLRASAVCYVDSHICVFDCIEFNRRFRFSDTTADVAFLASDLALRGRADLGQRFVDGYIAASGDQEMVKLIEFYECYRAYVRGKVESFRMIEPEVPPAEKAQARATAVRAFDAAGHYAVQLPVPRLVMMCGLSGTGKSAVAQDVADLLGAEVLASDVIRKQLAGIRPTERHVVAVDTGIYSKRMSARTYAELLRRAATLIDGGKSVVLDATFLRRADRDRAKRLAHAHGALLLCVECRADPETVRSRLTSRDADGNVISDARWETWLAQVERQDPIVELDTWTHVIIDTATKRDITRATVHRELSARLSPADPLH